LRKIAGTLFIYSPITKEVKIMKEIWNWVQAALTALGGFLGWFLGGFDGLDYYHISRVDKHPKL
jgi:hypothetical protein